ncbi:diguanylate cyclase [Nitrosomonas sp. Nm51]|uniref:GGDEF domain-containing protein n=1 Tax=Nitrosomonas sp. Nm51 TaxID=133720 RepID=UPI0008D3A868|nr:diguanylate cyclase [Nitrosomonas sp. Nm51]SER27528.1 diguanylate cyclase [Nitrosomonas sp. Nm51]
MDANPSIIARKTLLRLAELKIQPTPDNYNKIYDEIAGNPNHRMSATTFKLLSSFVKEFPRHTQELNHFANKLDRAIQNKNWNEYKSVLMKLAKMVGDSGRQPDSAENQDLSNKVSWADTIAELLSQLNANHAKVTLARKREGLNQVLTGSSTDSAGLQKKITALMESWDYLARNEDQVNETGGTDPDNFLTPATVVSAKNDVVDATDNHRQLNQDVDGNTNGQLLELLMQILAHVASIKDTDKSLGSEAEALSQKIRGVESKQELEQFVLSFKQFLDKFDYFVEGNAKLRQCLLRLLDKLLDSTGKLFSEDEWINSQISKLRATIHRPLDKRLMIEAENYLDEIIQRQSIIKRSLGDAKSTLKQMVTSLISNIEELSDETGEYHAKIEVYSKQISETDDLQSLNHLLVEIMQDTRKMQESTQVYRDGFLSAREEVEVAQEKIVQLETELQQMSEKIHEDHLTKLLNRRGLDLAFEREVQLAQRQQRPICYALLDIDNFKMLNDTHGHKVGDEAIVYLVNAVKNVTRNEDIVARYGGEEFVILLPDTELAEAVDVLSRIRRDLTKKFFLHENKRILITFSAGVAEYRQGERQDQIFKRADEALYLAKKNGKNLILEAA